MFLRNSSCQSCLPACVPVSVSLPFCLFLSLYLSAYPFFLSRFFFFCFLRGFPSKSFAFFFCFWALSLFFTRVNGKHLFFFQWMFDGIFVSAINEEIRLDRQWNGSVLRPQNLEVRITGIISCSKSSGLGRFLHPSSPNHRFRPQTQKLVFPLLII